MPLLSFKTDTSGTEAAFAAAARAADKAATKGLRAAAKQIALPIMRQTVQNRLPGVTQAGATARGAYVRQKHPGAAIDEFGGIRNDTIAPKSSRALATPFGPRAVVKGPRKYRGAHVFEVGVRRARPAMNSVAEKEILRAFEAEGFSVS